MKIKVGDKAPEFTLPSQDGTQVSLSNFLGKKNVVIYFYPKDDTPGCTKEACAFRDQYQVFTDTGAEVIGISGDTQQSHKQFATKYNLPFTLLCDTNNKVRQLYDVPATLWILPGRVTYVIDKEGIIRHIFDSMLDFEAHVKEALKTLKAISV
ncbi:MAG: peroxiredoxin [Okeania sp. SIO3I5]|uniref:peroxiredoxin n=1 Tax=Okeania sp. SIO3I5 TaxID=2607805 RepID=UPI0013BD4D11|nr:peroxiredoxin [Okeania sp. SIO3I5]NEQ37710.1 peroxiredoxin [Okeania sp. SIO3I5]